MAKYPALAEKISKCIKRGDFILSGFPSERRLAEIYAVSRMTARRTVSCLIDSGILVRSESGRLLINSDADSSVAPQVAFLAQASNSYFVQNLRVCAERLAPEFGMHVRSVDFIGWEDPVFNDTLNNFSAIFLAGAGSRPEEGAVKKIKECGKPIVVVEGDLSHYGIPSIMIYTDKCVTILLDHFKQQGHRNIDCFNTLPLYTEVRKRIDVWSSWVRENGLAGRLISRPGGSAPDTLQESYDLMTSYLRESQRDATAVFFTGGISAVGALRAVSDFGLIAGRDISACSLGGDGLYRYLTPSLTAIDIYDPKEFFSRSFQWFAEGGGAWEGELLMEPENFTVFPGETCVRLN